APACAPGSLRKTAREAAQPSIFSILHPRSSPRGARGNSETTAGSPTCVLRDGRARSERVLLSMRPFLLPQRFALILRSVPQGRVSKDAPWSCRQRACTRIASGLRQPAGQPRLAAAFRQGAHPGDIGLAL